MAKQQGVSVGEVAESGKIIGYLFPDFEQTREPGDLLHICLSFHVLKTTVLNRMEDGKFILILIPLDDYDFLFRNGFCTH